MNFNTKTGEIKTTASQAFHAKAIRNSVEKIIRDKTTLKDYSIAIDSKSSEEFKDDFNSFVTDKATTIDVTFFFDNEISDYDARNMIDFMKAMRNKEFNGHLDYLVDDYFSETFDYRKNYTVEDIVEFYVCRSLRLKIFKSSVVFFVSLFNSCFRYGFNISPHVRINSRYRC